MNTALQRSSLWDDSQVLQKFSSYICNVESQCDEGSIPSYTVYGVSGSPKKSVKLLRAAHLSKLKPEVTTTTHPQLGLLVETNLSKFPLSTYPASSC